MPDFTGDNLRRLMSQHGLSIDRVASCSGLDHRTIHAILDGTKRAHSRTLHRLAKGLKVPVDEFFLDPSQLLYRRFDRDTNPVVGEVVENHPEVFQGWTEADFDELHSRFGAGGCLTAEGALAAAERMNGNRAIHEKLALLLETSQADVIRGIVELMYEKAVATKGGDD